MAAWGIEGEQYNGYEDDDWEYGYTDMNHMGHQFMFLECGIAKIDGSEADHRRSRPNENREPTVSGRRDPLRGVAQNEPVDAHTQTHTQQVRIVD